MLSREEEESEEPEITLSTASLLGLFLGLVLVCGVFFGFGYSVGRRATANVESDAAGAASNNGAEGADAESRPPKTSGADAHEVGSGSSSPAPSDVSSMDADSAAVPSLKPSAERSGTVTLPVVETAAPVQKAVERQVAQAPAENPGGFRTEASQSQEAHAMVQVAAVVHQEDADVLVAALRKRGYNAVVRSGEPQDKLLHIQVGPFATRAEANAMKQKLASDGYNAIIKQ